MKALACELPATHGLPLGRFSRTELHRLVIERGLSEASASTIWRWLHDDALKPWQQRSWIFVRDPRFAEKAGRVLDLYQRRFEGRRLRPDEYVICADEKSQLQALGRRHPTLPPAPGRPARVEFDYRRNGTLAYLAGWDVHHANLFDRVEAKTGIEPFGRLVEQVMSGEPYASARTVYWIVDNGSSHAGNASIDRLAADLDEPAADPPADPRLLAQPDRALLLDRPTQSAHTRTTSTPSTRSANGCSASATTTARSPSRSSGRSPAPTSTGSSPGSTPTSPDSRSPHDRTCGRVY